MRNIIIIMPHDIDILTIFKNIDNKYSITQNEYNDIIIQDNDSRLYINHYDDYQEDFEGDEIKKIKDKINNPKLYTFEFNDTDFAWHVLSTVAELDQLMFDDDHGNIYTGKQFYQEILNNRGLI